MVYMRSKLWSSMRKLEDHQFAGSNIGRHFRWALPFFAEDTAGNEKPGGE